MRVTVVNDGRLRMLNLGAIVDAGRYGDLNKPCLETNFSTAPWGRSGGTLPRPKLPIVTRRCRYTVRSPSWPREGRVQALARDHRSSRRTARSFPFGRVQR